MPSGRINQTLYIGPYTNIERMNTTTLYKAGELGSQIEISGKAYQVIQVDSGATASTGAGALPLCGHVAFWKDRSNYLVTNDKSQADVAEGNAVIPNTAGTGNSVAGVFCSITQGAAGTASITPGSYGVIQQRGRHIGVLCATAGAKRGDLLVSTTSSTSATPTTTALAPGATLTANQIVGVATAATAVITAGYAPAIVGVVDLVGMP